MINSDNKVQAWVVKSILSILMISVGALGGNYFSSRNSFADNVPIKYNIIDANKELYLALITNNTRLISEMKNDINELHKDIKEILKKL